MRAILLAFIAAILLSASPASAAPTCRDLNGNTIRCGTEGAMPVGWMPSPELAWEWELSRPAGPPTSEVLGTILGIGLLLALFALLPKFDGSHAGDWDRQEGDED